MSTCSLLIIDLPVDTWNEEEFTLLVPKLVKSIQVTTNPDGCPALIIDYKTATPMVDRKFMFKSDYTFTTGHSNDYDRSLVKYIGTSVIPATRDESGSFKHLFAVLEDTDERPAEDDLA